jgi:hypothetical protein
MSRNGEDHPDLEGLLDELRMLLSDVDPVPGEVVSYAKTALGFRRIDAELAELTYDSRLRREPLAATRAGAKAVRLTFGSSALTVDFDVDRTASGIELRGYLVPASRASIHVQQDDASRVASAEADERGQFRVELPHGGRIRLQVLRESQPSVETSWITI